MITVKLNVLDYLLMQKGMYDSAPCSIIGEEMHEEITAQPGWDGVVHLEPVPSSDTGTGMTRNRLLWRLQRIQDWQESQSRTDASRLASAQRVADWDAKKLALQNARSILVKTNKFTEKQITYILDNKEKYPNIINQLKNKGINLI